MDNFNKKLLSVLERFNKIKNKLSCITEFDGQESIALSKEFAELEPVAECITKLFSYQHELKELQELISTDTDIEMISIAEIESQELKEKILKTEHQIKILLLPKDIDDDKGAILEIRAGTGGEEAGLFGSDLFKMYEMYSAIHGWKFETLELNASGLGAIKEASVSISGRGVFARLKYESGVHRLVRISPFDSNARRHTSFASVWVYPVVDDSIQIDINPADCRIDLYRASGAGGQHVNRTESAIRITHIPTGIVVACQTQRSQFANRDEAWRMLKARLYEMELQKRREEQGAIEAAKGDNGWGNQIRSYVLQPYQMVKDLRTGFETSDTQGVLDGELNGFMRASLAGLLKKEKPNGTV